MASELLSVLQARMAIRLNFLSLQESSRSDAATCTFQHRSGEAEIGGNAGRGGLGNLHS